MGLGINDAFKKKNDRIVLIDHTSSGMGLASFSKVLSVLFPNEVNERRVLFVQIRCNDKYDWAPIDEKFNNNVVNEDSRYRFSPISNFDNINFEYTYKTFNINGVFNIKMSHWSYTSRSDALCHFFCTDWDRINPFDVDDEYIAPFKEYAKKIWGFS